MTNGRSYTSNNAKLLKQLDTLKGLQEGIVSPVMVHLAPTNVCNLKCDFCCFADRNNSQSLSLDEIVNTLHSFKKLGTNSVEFTGGGEPTLHPQINEAIVCAKAMDYNIGMCTNSTDLERITTWKYLDWVRLSLNLFDQGKEPDISTIRGPDISAAYVWNNPNPENFYKMVHWAEKNKVPTRVAVNAIKPVEEIEKDMQTVKNWMSEMSLNYVFLSDFNLQTERRNNNCYMHLIKPFVFPDGNVYSCPSFELALENGTDVNPDFKICSIDEIVDTYQNIQRKKEKNCSFCKYASQNELIEDLLMETKHNGFC